MCTHVLYDTHKADGAALSDVILSTTEDECRGYHYVQIEIMGYCACTDRHLQQIDTHTIFTSLSQRDFTEEWKILL
jgi:hypothetical protein